MKVPPMRMNSTWKAEKRGRRTEMSEMRDKLRCDAAPDPASLFACMH